MPKALYTVVGSVYSDPVAIVSQKMLAGRQENKSAVIPELRLMGPFHQCDFV